MKYLLEIQNTFEVVGFVMAFKGILASRSVPHI